MALMRISIARSLSFRETRELAMIPSSSSINASSLRMYLLRLSSGSMRILRAVILTLIFAAFFSTAPAA